MFTIDRMRAGYADYAGEYVNADAVYYYYDDDDYEDDDTHCAAGVYVRTVLAPLSQGRTDTHIPPFVRSLFITSPRVYAMAPKEAPKFGVKSQQWKVPALKSQFVATGGLVGKRTEPVTAAVHPITKGVYVKLTITSRWLQRMVAGRCDNTCLSSTTVATVLFDKMLSAHGNVPQASDDQMQALYEDDDNANDHGDGLAVAAVIPPLSQSPPSTNIPMNTILTVAMPAICPTADAIVDSTERLVKLWYRGRRSVWLSTDDVEWVSSYMRVELETCGVTPTADFDSQPSSLDDDHGDGLDVARPTCIKWDFERLAWSFMQNGQMPLRYCGPGDLMPSDIPADQLPAGALARDVFDSLSYSDKKSLAYDTATRLAHAV